MLTFFFFYILPVQLSSFSTQMHQTVSEISASSPKPKASSTKSGKKFSACSHVPKTASPPPLDHKHLIHCAVLAGVWEMPENDILHDVYVCTLNKPTHTFSLLVHSMMYEVKTQPDGLFMHSLPFELFSVAALFLRYILAVIITYCQGLRSHCITVSLDIMFHSRRIQT